MLCVTHEMGFARSVADRVIFMDRGRDRRGGRRRRRSSAIRSTSGPAPSWPDPVALMPLPIRGEVSDEARNHPRRADAARHRGAARRRLHRPPAVRARRARASRRPGPRSAPWSPAVAPASTATGSRRCPSSASSRSTASAPTASTWRSPAAGRRRHHHARHADRGRRRHGHGADAGGVAAIASGDRFVRAGAWAAGKFPLAAASGRRLGIFGLGQIGRALARRAEVPDGDRLLEPPPAEVDFPGCRRGGACPRQRFLVLAASGGASTKGWSTAPCIALGPEGILINVARGSVVDEPELIAALLAGRRPAPGSTSSQMSPRSDARSAFRTSS